MTRLLITAVTICGMILLGVCVDCIHWLVTQ